MNNKKKIGGLIVVVGCLILSGCSSSFVSNPAHDALYGQLDKDISRSLDYVIPNTNNPIEFIEDFFKNTDTNILLGPKISKENFVDHTKVTVELYINRNYQDSKKFAMAKISDFCQSQDGGMVANNRVCVSDKTAKPLFFIDVVRDTRIRNTHIYTFIVPPKGIDITTDWDYYQQRLFFKYEIRAAKEREEEHRRQRALYPYTDPKIILRSQGEMVCKQRTRGKPYPIYIGFVEGAVGEKVRVHITSFSEGGGSISGFVPRTVIEDPSNWYLCGDQI